MDINEYAEVKTVLTVFYIPKSLTFKFLIRFKKIKLKVK